MKAVIQVAGNHVKVAGTVVSAFSNDPTYITYPTVGGRLTSKHNEIRKAVLRFCTEADDEFHRERLVERLKSYAGGGIRVISAKTDGGYRREELVVTPAIPPKFVLNDWAGYRGFTIPLEPTSKHLPRSAHAYTGHLQPQFTREMKERLARTFSFTGLGMAYR